MRKKNILSGHKIKTCYWSILKDISNKKKEIAIEIEIEGKLSTSMDIKKEDNDKLFSNFERKSSLRKHKAEL